MAKSSRTVRAHHSRSPFEILEGRQLLSATLVNHPAHLHPAVAKHHQAHVHVNVHHHGPRLHTNDKVLKGGHTVNPNATTGPVSYTPAQIRHAYGWDQTSATGAGQTIAIVDAYNDPHIATDLSTFDTQWGLPAASLGVVSMNSSAPTDAGWGMETALDVEWAHAMAPGARILLVEAASSNTSDLLSAVNYADHQMGVSVVSMSWGGSEFSSETYYDSYFNKAGVTFVASAGDTGAAREWPSESPNVVSVGGTNIPLDASGNRTGPETAWTSGGGGYSAYERKPNYQASVQSSGVRTAPDVSYDADPNTGFYVYNSNYNGSAGWYDVGGTSAGAPQWAALVAAADQVRAANGKAALGGIQQTLPALYAKVPASHFNDVTSGSNGYSATAGYDLATGRGTPFSNQVINDLASV